MTKGPASLLDRPDQTTEDALTELFRTVRFTRCVYYTMDIASRWPTIQVPEGRTIASSLGPRSREVLSYHMILEGTAFASLETGDSVKLEAGDAIVFPRGDAYFLAHTLATQRTASPNAGQLGALLAGIVAGKAPTALRFGPEGGERTRFVCSFLGCDPRPFDSLLEALPRVLHLRGINGRLKELVDLAVTTVDGPGAASLRERLSESMFIETVRDHAAQLPSDRSGWTCGLRDPIVARALATLHSDPAHAWSLDVLAKKVGTSRSVLADRFTKLVGQPPMQYLTSCRMQAASHLLGEGSVKVSEVAREVGYDSEAAFSRAFKKAHGVAPAAYARRRPR